MTSYWIRLDSNTITNVLIRRRKLEHRGKYYKNRGKDWRYSAILKECQGALKIEGARIILHWSLQKHSPANTLISDF